MNDHQLQAANIHNLTKLWRCMGAADFSTVDSPNIARSESWPHRLWLDWDHQPHERERLLELARDAANAVVPLWPQLAGPGTSSRKFLPPQLAGPSAFEAALRAADYRLLFEQTAMVLALKNTPQPSVEMSAMVEPVTNARDITRWTIAASVAFQYTIDPEIILRAFNDPRVTLLMVQLAGEIAGTGLLFDEATVLGVHQVGVLPAFRRRGIAKQLMLHAIAAGHRDGQRHLTLQASAAGLGLYQRLGFECQFDIRNYILPTTL